MRQLWLFRNMHMYVVFAAEEIEHKGCQRDNHCADECRKECFNLEVDTEILRQICSNQQQHAVYDDGEHTQREDNHGACDERQYWANKQIDDAVYHGDDTYFVPVAAECYAGNQRKCSENRQAGNQPLQDVTPQGLHTVFLVFHEFPYLVRRLASSRP